MFRMHVVGEVVGGALVQLAERQWRNTSAYSHSWWVVPAVEIVAAGVLGRMMPRLQSTGVTSGIVGGASYQAAAAQEAQSKRVDAGGVATPTSIPGEARGPAALAAAAFDRINQEMRGRVAV